MSEIEKMYDNANVKKQIPDVCSSNELYCKGCIAYIENAIPYCKNAEYPPFTADKQLELVKWLSINYLIEFKKIDSTQEYYIGVVTDNNKREWWASVNFENALAAIINNLWQDLTEQEQEQIRSILNGSSR